MEEAAQHNDHGHVLRMSWQAKTGPGYKSYLIKDINGNVLSTEAKCLCHWAGYFQQLLNQSPPQADEDLLIISSVETSNSSNSLTSPVTAAEVRTALRSLKIGHPLGVCSITTKLIKTDRESLIQWLVHIINQVWIHEELSDDWRWGVILPFWKCKGDKLICSNHRDITFLSMPEKLFMCILLSRDVHAIHSRHQPQQASFMPNTQLLITSMFSNL